MPADSKRGTLLAAASPLSARLLLAPSRAGRAVLDGAWWPRSWDPAGELPGLILALSARYGQVRQMMLNAGAWEGRFRRLQVGTMVVRMGWFASLDVALLIAITDRGDQLDLLVVPPSASPAAAKQAMRMAADPRNLIRASDILTAEPAFPVRADVDDSAHAVWDNEGGSIPDGPA